MAGILVKHDHTAINKAKTSFKGENRHPHKSSGEVPLDFTLFIGDCH